MKHNKAQSAIEFIILVGAILFFFLVFILIIQENIAEKKYEKVSFAVKEVALTIQDEIALASSASEGYSRVFNVPEEINGLEYEVNLVAGSVYIRTDDGRHALSLIVSDVVGDVVKGSNVIRKQDGIVYLN